MAPSLLVQRLLGEVPVETFLREHWLKQPLWRKGAAAELTPFAQWQQVEELVLRTPCDLLCVRDGKVHPGGRPQTADALQQVLSDGYSLALRQPDHHDRELAALGRTFVAELFGRLNLHVYCTPTGHGSFGWHCDPEEVFIVQTAGTKRYEVRENTVNRFPLEEAMASRAELERETSPVTTVELHAGDWLYIPGGWWHTTQAVEQSVSISVGILPPTAVDFLDWLRAEWVKDERLRARLPPLGRASATTEEEKVSAAQAALSELTGELARQGSDPAAVSRFISQFGMAAMTAMYRGRAK